MIQDSAAVASASLAVETGARVTDQWRHRASSAQRQTWISLPFKTVSVHIPADMVSQTHRGRGLPGESISDMIKEYLWRLLCPRTLRKQLR